MTILDKAKEAAAAAFEKTRELASSAAEAVEEAGVKAKELAQEAGATVAEGASKTVEKARSWRARQMARPRELVAQLPMRRLSIASGNERGRAEG